MVFKEAIKKIIEKTKQAQRIKEIKIAAPRITKKRIVKDLKKLDEKRNN